MYIQHVTFTTTALYWEDVQEQQVFIACAVTNCFDLSVVCIHA